MIIEILKHTPSWVFGLFFVLLGLGISRARACVVPLARAIAVPIVMIVLSLSGVITAFHGSSTGLVAWMGAVGLTVGVSQRLGYTRGAVFDPVTRLLSIPGSWLPLLLMMGIFFIKYGVAITLARNPALASVPVFIASASMVYGLVSGIFLAGAISVWKATTHREVRIA